MSTPPVRIPANEALRFSHMQTDINTFWRESAVQFITGDMDVNRDGARYIANFNALQIDRYVALLQSSYDAFVLHSR
jgi:putative aldouronate transport system substrate-binding protein